MMPPVKIDRKLLLEVAKNARLELTEQEIKEFLPQLQEILEIFAKLEKVDVRKEQPSFQPTKLKNVMREDSVGECLSQEEALSNTPKTHRENGYFKGPKVV